MSHQMLPNACAGPCARPSSLAPSLDQGARADDMFAGEWTFPRWMVTGTFGPAASGAMVFTAFTAQKSERCGQIEVYTGTAAGATPTVCRLGVYEVTPPGMPAPNSIGHGKHGGFLTLVASIPNETTLMSAGNSTVLRSFSAPFDKIAGKRYAVGVIVVTAAALPTWSVPAFNSQTGLNAMLGRWPWITATLAGQADLPATIDGAPAGLSLGTNRGILAGLLP